MLLLLIYKKIISPCDIGQWVGGWVGWSVGLSVCLYHHSGQTSKWISLKLGMMLGFGST